MSDTRPTKVAGKEFKCPKCGCPTLEEVISNVTQSSSITEVDAAGIADFANVSSDGGEVERIQCLECGHVVTEGRNAYEDLVKQAESWK